MSIQAVLIVLGGLALFLSTVALVRLRLLSIRYGLGWMALAMLGVLGAPLLSALSDQVGRFGFTSTGFSLGVAFVFLGLVCLQLSISLSGLHRAVQDLAEYAALVEQRVRVLEEADRGLAAPLSAAASTVSAETREGR